jgi:restriction system protein
MMWPVIVAVRGLGGTARLEEIDEAVIDAAGFSDEQLAVLHNDGPRTEIAYRLGWARSYLKKMGMLTNATRGTWRTTPLGLTVTEEEIEPIWRDCLAEIRERRRRDQKAAEEAGADPEEAEDGGDDTTDWQEELVDVLLEMDPTRFEHLAERLLKAEGFTETEVTQRSGDGGIDGTGVYLISLVSFRVYFQCKRYRGSVGPDLVRDFRGAVSGRGERGLLITTGTFTKGAIDESKRGGGPKVDLIDGRRLCLLLKANELGVETETVERVRIDSGFFQNLPIG